MGQIVKETMYGGKSPELSENKLKENNLRIQTQILSVKDMVRSIETHLAGQNVCFRYGKPGHMARNCQILWEIVPFYRLQNQGRVFALIQREAEKPPDLIRGKIPIYNVIVNTLFDSGATHLFYILCMCKESETKNEYFAI